MGADHKKKEKEKWQLLNFLSGEAKMAIYVSRRNKMEGREGQDVIEVWRVNVKSRLWLEYRFFKQNNDFSTFKEVWAFKNILCCFQNNELLFAQFLT